MPVVDGKPSPFGVRFQLNTRPTPNGPVIVAVPAGPLEHEPPPDAAATAEAAASATPDAETAGEPQSPSDDTLTTGSVQASRTGDVMTIAAKPDDADKDDVSATNTVPARPSVAERLAVPGASPRVAPEIRIVAREAENPASVNTSPAPTLAHKVNKRRKLAAHLPQLHHFRRPHIHAPAAVTNQTPGYLQPDGFASPSGLMQPNVNAFAQPNGFAQPGGLAQPGYPYTPAAIKPKSVKIRHSASQ